MNTYTLILKMFPRRRNEAFYNSTVILRQRLFHIAFLMNSCFFAPAQLTPSTIDDLVRSDLIGKQIRENIFKSFWHMMIYIYIYILETVIEGFYHQKTTARADDDEETCCSWKYRANDMMFSLINLHQVG